MKAANNPKMLAIYVVSTLALLLIAETPEDPKITLDQTPYYLAMLVGTTLIGMLFTVIQERSENFKNYEVVFNQINYTVLSIIIVLPILCFVKPEALPFALLLLSVELGLFLGNAIIRKDPNSN